MSDVVRLDDASRLPPEVQPYANGENGEHVITPAYPEYSREIVWKARQLRRNMYRRYTSEHPGLQWHKFPDYGKVLSQDIETHTRVMLEPTLLDEWFAMIDKLPLTKHDYESAYRIEMSRHTDPGPSQRNRALREAMRSAIRLARLNGRKLGAIEELVLGHVRFGEPSGSNHPPED